MLRVWGVENVTIEGASLDGRKCLDSAPIDPAKDGHGMGISVAGSNNMISDA
jgi:hypothetical protein